MLSAPQIPADGDTTGKPFHGTVEFPGLQFGRRFGQTRMVLKGRSKTGASGEVFYRA